MTCMRAGTSSNFSLTAESPYAYNGKTMSPLDRILFILAGNDNIHKSLDEFEILLDPTTGFHGNT